MRFPRLGRFALVSCNVWMVACGRGEDLGPTLLQRWQSEADAHGPMGSEGSFRLEGAATLVGPTGALAVVTAPFIATLTIEEVIVGDVVAPADCSSTLVEAGSIDLGPATVVDVIPAAGEAEAALQLTIATADILTASALALPAGACFFRDGTLIEDALVVDGGVRVSSLRMAAREPPLETTVLDLAVGGTAVGTATIGDVEHTNVTAVMGFDATTRLEAGAVDGSAHITQVLDASGPLLAADVEFALNAAVLPSADDDEQEDRPARITKGDVVSIAVSFREKSYVGDGLLAAYEVTGPGAAHLQIAASPPTGAVAGLIDALESSGGAAPIVAIVVVATLPLAIIVDVIDGIFGNEPPRPTPLPSYIRAGEIGTFSVVVNGDDTVGVHEATLVIVGQNYEGAEVTLRWEIVAPE